MSKPLRTMLAKPVSDNRNDLATRELSLEDAPIIPAQSWRRNCPAYQFRPTRAILHWRGGQLRSVSLKGNRLKKDGTEGKIRESMYLRVEQGYVVELLSPPKFDTRWIQEIITLFGEVPAPTPADKPEYAATTPPMVEATIIVPDPDPEAL